MLLPLDSHQLCGRRVFVVIIYHQVTFIQLLSGVLSMLDDTHKIIRILVWILRPMTELSVLTGSTRPSSTARSQPGVQQPVVAGPAAQQIPMPNPGPTMPNPRNLY